MGGSHVLRARACAYVSRRIITTLESAMPRYVVEREFPDGLHIPIDQTGVRTCLAVIEGNLADQVTWVHSYVSADKKKTFCVYDAPSPEAVRRTAARNKLPVARITEVRVLDPYFFS
jgi:Protein of unknown function (DUF4242)